VTKAHRHPRLPATAPLLYWLLVVCGLVAAAVTRVAELDEVVALSAGAIFGTALGQLLATARFRLWMCACVIMPLLCMVFAATGPLWRESTADGSVLTLALMAFGPALLCGYLSLSERGALTSFWFPSSLWMLSILDRQGGRTLASGASWVLLSGLVALFIAFLRARETRRVGLWQRHAATRLSEARPNAVLRRTPVRTVLQAGWGIAVGLTAMTLAAWVAPALWHEETLPGHVVRAAAAPAVTYAATTNVASGPSTPGAKEQGVTAVVGAGVPATCCPEAATEDIHRQQLHEYFPLLHAHDEELPPPPASCVVCSEGTPLPSPFGTARGPSVDDVPGGLEPKAPGAQTVPPSGRSSAVAQTDVASSYVSPPAPVAPPTEPNRAPTAAGATAPHAPTALDAAPTIAPNVPATRPAAPLPTPVVAPPASLVQRTSSHPIAWLLTAVTFALALQFLLRPLRRFLTLRHLSRPLWPETVDQRVSNQWQRMLIGLRDAGWQAAPGEEPRELARRIGVEGVAECVQVLERARHGVRVDAADLAAMADAAGRVYATARAQVGWVARAVAWLRWPLL